MSGPITGPPTIKEKVDLYINGDDGEGTSASRIWLRARYRFMAWLVGREEADVWADWKYGVSGWFDRRFNDNQTDDDRI